MNDTESHEKKQFLFDFDGVICDSLQLCMQWFNRVGDENFPELPKVSSVEDMVLVYSGSLRTCLHRWLSPERSRAFFDAHSKAMVGEVEKLSTFSGIGAVLSALPKGSWSIVTSAYSTAVEQILMRDPTVLIDNMHTIAGREFHQPKSEKILNILSDLGVAPDDAVYVGDLESDVLYCRAVPIDIIAVGYGYHPTKHLVSTEPTFLADSVEELGILLAQLGGERP